MDHLSITDDQKRFIVNTLARASAGDLAGALILPECPADRHNTLTAARRGVRGRRNSAKCVCPRALELKAEALQRERSLRSAGASPRGTTPRAAVTRAPREDGQASYRRNVRTGVRAPNLFGAPCTTPSGLQLLERACSRENSQAPTARAEFVRRCQQMCPKLDECRAWVLGAEDPPGAWGKIYAGLSVNDRRRLAGGRTPE